MDKSQQFVRFASYPNEDVTCRIQAIIESLLSLARVARRPGSALTHMPQERAQERTKRSETDSTNQSYNVTSEYVWRDFVSIGLHAAINEQ